VRVKICGLVRREDVLVADALGADFVGVVLSGGFGRSVAPEAAPALVEGVRATRVAVLVDEDGAGAELRALALTAGVIQLHGSEPPALLRELAERGGWRLWKAVRVGSADDVKRAVERYADVATGLLLEGLKDGVVGGGGVRLEVAPDVVRTAVPAGVELILAGGLTPATVADAVERFRPDIVDVSSGVEESMGVKSETMVRRFLAEARARGAAA
jgi:phosphoribosylanthranilate isomerase